MTDPKIMETNTLKLKTHIIHIENRQFISITGVNDVESFNENEVILSTEFGELHVDGNGLHITKLSLDEGQVIIEGEIIAFDYGNPPDENSSLISRLFR